jgi:hypothetical protein
MKIRLMGLCIALLLACPSFRAYAADESTPDADADQVAGFMEETFDLSAEYNMAGMGKGPGPQRSETKAEIDFGPIFQKNTDIYGNTHWRALGPLLESRRADNGNELFAFRPLYSYALNAAEKNAYRHFLYPIWFQTTHDTDVHWRFMLLMLYHDYDTDDPAARYKFWLVPFYFQGRDEESTPYLGIFPLVGNIRDLWFFDEFRFALFPLAFGTRINEVRTTACVWPIFSRTTGGGNDRLSVFPLYGYSKLRDESDKYFFMWPFWTHARYAPPQSPGYAYVFFPFYGRVNLENQTEVMLIPPLFRFARGIDQTQTYTPWPFLQFNTGRVNKRYIWPLWGYREREGSRYSFLLWPLGIRYDHTAAFYEHHRTMFFPFIYSTVTRGRFDRPDRKMSEPRRTLKIWPLFSYMSDSDEMRFSALSLFPFRDYDAIERNYGALWTLYSRGRYKGQYEDEFLWGLIRYRRSESFQKFSFFPLVSIDREREKPDGDYNWSFLKGLFACEKAGGKRRIRLLYFIRF